jgi:hypothetical protein
MTMSPAKSSAELRQSLLGLLWQQWAVLGIAGSTPAEGGWCVDLEALLLVTTTQARADPRLFDEVLDWLWGNGQCVNVQRLRNIHRRIALGDSRVLSAIADWLSQRSKLTKWKPLAAADGTNAENPEPLFRLKDGRPQPMFGEVDPIFERHGFTRGPIKRRKLSQQPNPRPAAALSWKLRALFGVQARCDILLCLLTRGAGYPADLTRATFYFPRTVEEALKELAASGLVHTGHTGRKARYWLKPEDWQFLRTWSRPADFPRWVDWPRLFAAQERFLGVLDNAELSPMLLSSELRRAFDELQPMLADGGLDSAFTASRSHTGVSFTEALINDLRRLAKSV